MNMDCDLNKYPFLISIEAHHIVVRVYVQPNAKKTEYTGVYDDALRIRVTARAVENKANQAIVEYLAECFEVKRKDVILLSGEQSRKKQLAIYGIQTHLLMKCEEMNTKHV
ncbi:MAG: DUF167 domain-containing protein [Desulfovibrionaceae bacterium]|nr:DUF167 domain-containing protein [Desulfovibrionaceae bacterium]